MTRNQITLRQPSSNRRRRPLLVTSQKSASASSSSKGSSSARLAEVAGGTAAECAIVCCCCPCGLMELLVLAIYRVPAGLCKRVLRKRRRKRSIVNNSVRHLPACSSTPPPPLVSGKKGAAFCGCGGDDDETEMYTHRMKTAEKDRDWGLVVGKGIDGFVGVGGGAEKDLMELEKEMWQRFYSTSGFWRSPSQRETYAIDPCLPDQRVLATHVCMYHSMAAQEAEDKLIIY